MALMDQTTENTTTKGTGMDMTEIAHLIMVDEDGVAVRLLTKVAGSRKRRRSPSPFERERYEPRPRYSDDYDGHSRGYGHSPPRRSHVAPYGRRPPPDPHTLDYPASLKQYADWFRFYYPQQAQEEDNADKAAEQEAGDGSKPRNGIKSRWEKYKKDFAAQQLQTMFDHHKKSPWFWEKYDPAPEFQKLRSRVRKEGWRGRLSTFLHDLESGKFDPDFRENEGEQSTSLMKETGDTSVLDTAEEIKIAGDDDMQFNIEADEEEPRGETNGKAKDNNRFNRAEEASVPTEGNQVMIRTIPPDIGRIKLEESCKVVPGFVYLALGDPLQKRNYYRAGWIRFADDADMTLAMNELQDRKVEGFKLHVTHNTKPFVSKVRFAPEVASRLERMQKDLANARILAGLLEEEAATLRKFKISPQDTPDTTGIEDTPMPDSNDAEAEQDEEEPLERGSDAVDRRIERLLAELRDQDIVDPSDETAHEHKKVEISLDLYITYLRAAFNCCYYCCVVTDHLEELQRKCIKHVRKPLSKPALDEMKEGTKVADEKDEDQEEKSPEKEKEKETRKGSEWKKNQTDERWLEWLDSKIALLINRDNVDPRDYGGKNYDEELSKILEPHIKQEDEGKFRCRVHLCQKLFKAASFVEKHIANKHPELIKPLDDLQYFNNFVLDPHRIQPFTHVPPQLGNSAQAPPQAYGLQGPVFGGDHGRYSGYPPVGAYSIPPSAGYWGEFPGRGFYPEPIGVPPLPRREETNPRRLSERISGFATTDIPATAGLPAKPPPPSLDAPLSAGGSGVGTRKRGGGGGQSNSGPPPPPPPDAKEDPRAAAGRKVSYHDMDLVAEGDVELSY
ncbi:hypothetical protein L218DRAFT_954708 [Marasmius fiardii PR-910]|nr:hypothetical protein L218DRAFT_954708 [Marasmius fiardii PR-910]